MLPEGDGSAEVCRSSDVTEEGCRPSTNPQVPDSVLCSFDFVVRAGETVQTEGCQDPQAVVSTVEVDPASVALGSFVETVQLTAIARNASGNVIPEVTFTWLSGNVSVATVSTSGLVTAVAEGTTSITATTMGIDGTASITVAQNPGDPVNTYTTGGQDRPSVAMDPAGNFVIAWEAWLPGGSTDEGVYARRFGSNGAPVGAEFKVNTYTTGGFRHPSVAMDSAGNYVIAWESWDQDGDGYGIYARRVGFDAR